ncbi:MAG TPA: hypothetical protein VEC99_08850 [Clostridia bacterium]|nr:hypothetical protein [Clostridia bacterium]
MSSLLMGLRANRVAPFTSRSDVSTVAMGFEPMVPARIKTGASR